MLYSLQLLIFWCSTIEAIYGSRLSDCHGVLSLVAKKRVKLLELRALVDLNLQWCAVAQAIPKP
jgi:hypothetical protein